MNLKKIFFLLIILISFAFIFINFEAIAYDPQGDMSSTDFKISVGDLTPGGDSLIGSGSNSKTTVENILMKMIEKMMVSIGIIGVFTMTVGGGYMVMHAGQDDLLSKGKTIFKSGLIALTVALMSGLLVKLVSFLLY